MRVAGVAGGMVTVWSVETFSNGPAILSKILFWRIPMPI